MKGSKKNILAKVILFTIYKNHESLKLILSSSNQFSSSFTKHEQKSNIRHIFYRAVNLHINRTTI
jgi:hypothetical protein